MSSPLEEGHEVILEKYLKFRIIDRLYRSRSWLISDECDLSEK
jgi:hypothetical protein